MKQPTTEQELERMKDAYGMLYEIETKLRRIVIANLVKRYGHSWLVQRYENKMYLHDLISYFGKYPQELPHFEQHQRRLLCKLPSIRNKVAHANLIDDNEFKHLTKCYRLVKRQPITKRKRPRVNHGPIVI